MTDRAPRSLTRVGLVVSARAGRGRAPELADRLAQRLTGHGLAAGVIQRPDPESAAAEIRARLSDPAHPDAVDAIVVLGGDGGLHVAANAVLDAAGGGASAPLGLVPCGTGNDFAGSLGVPVDAEQALARVTDAILAGRTRSLDVAALERTDGASGHRSNHYASVLAAGFDAVVSLRANRMSWAKGGIKYTLATARELPLYRPRTYRITIDGQTTTTRALLVCVANAARYGGGMRIAPHADPADGLLDVVVVRPVPLWRFPLLFPKVFDGTHDTLDVVDMRQGREVVVEVADGEPFEVTADGEPIGALPMTVRVAGGRLTLLD